MPATKKAVAVKKPAAKEAPVRRVPMPGDTLEVHLAEFPIWVDHFMSAAASSVKSLDLTNPKGLQGGGSLVRRGAHYLHLIERLVESAARPTMKRLHEKRLKELHEYLSHLYNDALYAAYLTAEGRREQNRHYKVYWDAEAKMNAAQQGLSLSSYLKKQEAAEVAQIAELAAREAARLVAKAQRAAPKTAKARTAATA